MMRLRSSTHSTNQNQRSAAGLPPFTANVGVWRKSGQIHWDHKCRLFVHLEGLPRFGFTLWVSLAECAGPLKKNIKKISTSSCVESVCKMSLPVSSTVLNKLRNCPWLASWDMRWSGTRATIGGCGASQRPKWKRWKSACLRSTLLLCTAWRHRPICWVWLSSHQCSTRSVPKSFVNQKGLRRHKLCSHYCVREKELLQQTFLRKSTTVTLVTWRVECNMAWECNSGCGNFVRRRPHAQANLHVTEELQQRVPHMTLVFIIKARGRRNWRACASGGSLVFFFDREPFFIIFDRLLFLVWLSVRPINSVAHATSKGRMRIVILVS